MGTLYDQLSAQPAQTPASEPGLYDALVEQDRQQRAVRGSLFATKDTTPERAAQLNYLSQVTGLPRAAVETDEGAAKAVAELRGIWDASATSPVLRARLANPKFTELAKDDVGVLSQIERGVQATTRYLMGADGRGGLQGDLKAGYHRSSAASAGAFRAVAETLAVPFDFLEEFTSIGGNPFRRLAEGFAGIADNQNAIADGTSSAVFGVSSGVQSFVQNSKYLPLAALGPGGAAAALTGMVSESFGASYQRARDQGLSQAGSLVYGASDAAIEYATEKLPLQRLIGDMAVDTGFVKMLGRQIALEIPGEQIATVLQDMNEWAALNPERSFRDYLNDRPSAAAETLIATAIGVGGNVTLVKGVDSVLNGYVQDQAAQTDAGQQALAMQQLLEQASQSRLRERDPVQFRDTMAEMARQAGTESVYVDAAVLNQMPPEVLQQLPGVAEQLADALAANSTVELKLADVLTVAPGTGVEQALVENLRMSPDALSQAEAQAAGQEAQTLLQDQAQRVMQQAADAAQMQAAADRVKTEVLAQLDTAGRFGQEVNDAYATLVRDFYVVLGQRLGVSPAEAYQRYPLQVAAQGQAGQVLEQDSPTSQATARWQTSMRHLSPRQADSEARMPVPAVVQSFGEKASHLALPVKVLQAIRSKHPDVPATVFENLPALLSDPLYVWPHRDGGVNVAVDATTAAGEPIIVGIRDGRIRTVTPYNDATPGAGRQRLLYNVNTALDQQGAKVYVRQKENLAEARSSASGQVRTKPAGAKQKPSAIVAYRDQFIKSKGDAFYQRAKGTFSPDQLLITLSDGADLSTFLHETGHFFLEVTADLAAQPGAPASVSADMDALLKWFGVADLATWQGMTLEQQRPHHERFAESFEQYLLEGRAPSRDLRALFRKFRNFLTRVYRSLQSFGEGRDLQLSDDVRQVMDRLLATDEQIAEAQTLAGMDTAPEATDEAVEKLQARSLRDLKWAVNARSKAISKLQAQARNLRKGIEAEVRAEVEDVQVYKAMRWLREENKLSIEGLESLYMGEGDRYALLDWKPLVDRRMAGKTGVHPDVAADMFGYPSGDALVRALLTAEPMGEVVEARTDQAMLERHGDLVDDRAIAEAATEAVHNEARAKSLATELAAQRELLTNRRATGETDARGRPLTVNAMLEAARQFAANVTGRKALGDLRQAAYAHLQAERRAAKAWERATAAGKTQEAVQAKQDQLLNHEVHRALVDAQRQVAKAEALFARVFKGTPEKLVERGYNPDVVAATRAVLAAYGLAPRAGKSAIEYLQLVEKNDPELFNVLKPSVDATLANAKPFDRLTFDELDALVAEVEAMQQLARRSRQMEVDGNLMDIDEAADQLKARMEAIGVPLETPGQDSAITPKQERTRWLQFARALARRMEQWAEAMDGGRGAFTRLVFGPVKAAADRYRADRAKYRKQYKALIDRVAPAFRQGEIAAPELNYTFGRGHNGIGHAELLHAILHTGNESNKRKLLLGRKWAIENEDGTLDTSRWDAFINRMQNEGYLAKAHYDFAQGVWDMLEATKPLAQKAHRDVFGRYFAEVTADAFDTPFGSYRGGYVPAQADPRIVTDAALRSLAEMENENMAFSFPSTNRGFTKGRTEYNRPLILDLRTIAQHMDKVLLFSHMEPAVRDVNRLLRDKGVSGRLSKIDPAAYEGALIPWLNRSARQQVETPVVGDGRVSRVLSAMRNRAGMSLMFANLSNTAQQITGFATAAIKVRPKHLLQASAQYLSDPKKTADFVGEQSIFMRDRMQNEIAAINDAMSDILLNPSTYAKAQAWAQRHAYFLQAAVDNVMSPIVWIGAYNQALEAGQSEADAAKTGDAAVRQTQGSTLPEDVSRIETGPAAARMFTQFVSYFNMLANTNGAELTKVAREVGLKRGAGKSLYIVTMGLLVPIWVAEAIAIAFRGGPEDDDEDGWYLDDWIAAVIGAGTIKGTLAMVPFVGQAVNAGLARWNGNPMDDRISLSPAVSILEGAVGAPFSVYKALAEDGNPRTAVRDVASAISLATGLPAHAAARPLGYLAGMAGDRVEPTGGLDMARGLVTGAVSPESRQ